MQPSLWLTLDSLPRLANGKIDKLSLKQIKPKQQETVDTDRALSGTERALSGTERALSHTEKTLLSIWQQVLGKNDITVDDNFFAVGGDSIIGLQIIAKARHHDITLMPKDIFAHKSVAALALMLAEAKPLEAIQVKSIPTPVKAAPVAIDDQAFASLLSELSL